MSSDKKHPLKTIGNFKQICSAQIEDTIPFYMYRSVKTGITVCVAEADGPFINGDFNIVTETCDNNGLPHAMQYLIFTGTKDDPYYNILKLWAKRSLGNISAYSSQYCNCFTMRAAGSEGFLNLMPKYLDHILYPSLEDSAYLTEVHHITGEGNNDGVVYRVTQKKEHTSDCIIHMKMVQALYPENCEYSSVIMGTTKKFRESTNNEKVKQFHETFYRPENLTVLITGKIHLEKIFEALLPLEKKIMLKKRKDKFKRPWQTPIKPLRKSVEVEVLFPYLLEICGEVHVAWRGPSPITHVCDYRGCLLLLDYLIKTSNSPLRKEFRELGDQLSITWDMSYWSDPYFEIIFKDIPIKHIDLITEKSIHQVFKNLCINGINMETMKPLIHKLSFDYQIELENNPHENIAVFLFNHLIYGNTDNLKKQLNMLHGFKDLIDQSETYFSTLLKNYFVDAPMVVVRGKPSSDTFLQLENEEKNVTAQNKALGQKYLKQKENDLQEAKKKKDKLLFYKDVSKVPMSDINFITFHNIEKYSTETAKQHPKLDVTQLPLFTYLTDVNTNFFYLQVIMNTSSISPEYKLYIPLLVKVITESPIKRGAQMIPYEEVKYLLFADNITVQSHIGINTLGHFPNSMSLILQAELHNYEKSVQWCKELLYDTKLTAERLKVEIKRLLVLNNIKLQGESIARSLLITLLYPDDTIRVLYNVLRQHKFLIDIQKRFNTDVGQEEVMAIIDFVRQTLTLSKNMFVHMAVNVNKLTEQFPDVYAPWNKFFSNFMNLEKTKVNISNSKVYTPYSIPYNGCIMGLDWINSSYLIQTCPCINDFQHSDLAALEVCLTYFKQKEGPIWKERPALSKFSLYTIVEDGYLTLKFCEAKNVVDAYKVTKSIVNVHRDNIYWDNVHFENAKSSTILNYINNVQSIKHVINASLAFYCKNLPHDYINKMIRRVSAVTLNDVMRMTSKYIIPFFDPKRCKLAIACNNNEVAEIKKAFQKMKFTLNVYKNVEELKDYIGNMTTK